MKINILSKKKAVPEPEKNNQTSSKKPRFFRLPLNQQVMFVKRLGILLNAGVPIVESLNMMKRQSDSNSAKYMLNDLACGMESGQYLHIRLQKYRKSFGDFAVNIVKVGEISGTLHESLGYLAEEIQKKKELRRKIVSALVYPFFIVFATIGITILLITYVFPKILPILQTFKGNLPITTRALIFISNEFSARGWLIGIAVLFLIILFFLLLRLKSFRLAMDKLLLKIPILGRIFQYYQVTNFCRTLAVLLKSDMRIIEAVLVTAKTSTNLAYQDAISKVSESVSKGGNISSLLEENEKLFPPLVWQMISVGENSGKLIDSLAYVGGIYEKELNELTSNLSATIEPLLMVFLGVCVGFVAISIITPIYQITQNLHP
jgi:type IV pilus assembly protein PilC